VLDRMELPAGVDDAVVALNAYAAFLLPKPVCEAHFEYLERVGRGEIRAELRAARRAKHDGLNAALDRRAGSGGMALEALGERMARDALENTAIFAALITALVERMKR